MSIAYFPEIYPDELLYSVLARFYQHSGYLYYKDVAQDIFKIHMSRLEKEFVKSLRPEVLELLTKHMTLKELLEKHTMYPYYGRFIHSDRKKKAYDALLSMDGDYSKLFGIPQLKKGEQRFLRYCPLCVTEDRELYGETYWHRIPQMRNVRTCVKHKCYFVNSGISMDSRVSMNLVSAEEIVLESKVLNEYTRFCEIPLEVKLDKYITEVFLTPMNESDHSEVENFLHNKLVGTPYISSRGEHKYYHKLWEDIREFYKGVPVSEELSVGQVQRILGGGRFVFEDICMVALFLGIGVEELTTMETSLMSPEKIFDEEVQRLWKSGLSINAIAREKGVASSMVRMALDISERDVVQRKYHKNNGSSVDWDILDKEALPMVKQAITDMHGSGNTRPCKISMYAVGKRTNISVSRLRKMQNCMQEIENSTECIEKYYARKIVWAINVLQQENKDILFWRFSYLCKLEKEDVQRSIPYLREIAPPEIVEIVQSLL